MKRVLVFQHMDHDTPGRFADFFAEDGYIPRTVRLWEGQAIPALHGFDFLFVLGGAQDVWETEAYPWLIDEMAAIREWVNLRARPYFGICLGHQLLATALGGSVGKAKTGEVGVHSITVSRDNGAHPFFNGLDGTHQVIQWHFAEVQALPPEATVLAFSEASAVQAMAVDDHAIGLQFHAEFTPQTVASWESLPGYIAALEKALGPGAYGRIVGQSYPMLPQMGVLARRIYQNVVRHTGLRKAA
jgi:GMP synthase-like glutamine amidotransferase